MGVATAIAVGSIAASAYGAHKASSAAKKASEQQAGSTREALDLQREMYGTTRGDLGPYREQGGQGLTALSSLLGVGGGPIGAGLETSPGYQFRLNEGLKALQRSAAARGTLLTGGTLKGLERYAQDYASGEYANRVNQLAGLAQMGQNAAAGQAASNAAFGGAGADLLTQRGNALAAGTVGSANAWQQAMGQAGNLAQMYYLSRLYGQPAAGTPPIMNASAVPYTGGGQAGIT